MAQLGELLGGMLTDVVRARMAADAATAEAVETYRSDPALASMSVPRVTISTLTVKLNFAVSGVVEADRKQVGAQAASEEWSTMVERRIAPLIPPAPPPRTPAGKAAAAKETPSGRTTSRAKTDVSQPGTAPLAISVPPEVVRGSVEGKVDALVDATVEGVVKASQAKITPEIREQITTEVRKEALLFADTIRRRELLDQALQSRLEVDIVADKVSGTKPEAMQSLEVTFSLDDLEEILPDSREWR